MKLTSKSQLDMSQYSKLVQIIVTPWHIAYFKLALLKSAFSNDECDKLQLERLQPLKLAYLKFM